MAKDKPITPIPDILTPLAATVMQAGGHGAYSFLVVQGSRAADARRLLQGVRPEQLIARPVADAEAANALLAALWLWHDCLGESHEISQSIASPTGSFWHAIMHRREGDFSNAKYWYRRCRTHPAMRTLAVAAAPVIGDPMQRATQAGVDAAGGNDFAFTDGFDPDAFVDRVERVHRRPPDDPEYAAAVAVQRAEWQVLFADCAFAAAGAGTILGGGIES